MTDFKPGEIVDITIKGARVGIDGALLSVRYPTRDGECPVQLDLQSDRITVTRVAPAEWPPQVDDLWRGKPGSGLWFAVPDRYGNVMLTNRNHALNYPDDVNQELGPLTLVYREKATVGPDDEEDPKSWTGPDGHVWDLTIGYVDDGGNGWQWAGGFQSRANDHTMWPLMSRDDWSVQDVLLFHCPELTPNSGNHCRCDHHGDHAGCRADCECGGDA